MDYPKITKEFAEQKVIKILGELNAEYKEIKSLELYAQRLLNASGER